MSVRIKIESESVWKLGANPGTFLMKQDSRRFHPLVAIKISLAGGMVLLKYPALPLLKLLFFECTTFEFPLLWF